MQTPSRENDINEDVKYQIGVFVQTNIVQVQHFRLEMPAEFVNPTSCTVRRGLVLKDVNDPFTPI